MQGSNVARHVIGLSARLSVEVSIGPGNEMTPPAAPLFGLKEALRLTWLPPFGEAAGEPLTPAEALQYNLALSWGLERLAIRNGLDVADVRALHRAADRCEGCGVARGWYRNTETSQVTSNRQLADAWANELLGRRTAHGVTPVVLSVVPVDHDYGNRAPQNLKVLCQACVELHHRQPRDTYARQQRKVAA